MVTRLRRNFFLDEFGRCRGSNGFLLFLRAYIVKRQRKNGLKSPVFSSLTKVFLLHTALSFGEGGRGSVKVHDEAMLFSSSYSLPEPVGVSRVLFKKHSEQKKLKTENEAFAVYAAAQY